MAAHAPFHVLSARLQSETPVCGVPLEPYIVVRRADGSTTSAEDVPQEGQADARFSVKCRWYRSVVTRGGALCWAHPEREAAVQCILCLRARAEPRRAYHCSPECLAEHWAFHRDFHAQAAARAEANGGGGAAAADGGGASPSPGAGAAAAAAAAQQAAAASYRGGYSYSNSGEAWVEVGRARAYTPTPDDVGAVLKFEVSAHDAASAYPDVGKTFAVVTARARPAPAPPRRALLALPPRGGGAAPPPRRGAFTVLSYNVLADLYASPEAHPGCPPWALAWPYRRANLVRELLGYAADVVCLQEVQSNHFAEWLAPELQRAGYTAIYKKKTAELYTRAAYAADGCATFFRRDRFALVKKYEVEFNKAALSLAEGLPPDQKKAALSRLLKDNVALIAVLEALDPPGGGGGAGAGAPGGAPPRRQLVCVANTHIHSNPELADVKLWQVHTLLKGLEKIAASADIPMLVAGDFNATPGSAAHALLVRGAAPAGAPELAADPLGILRPHAKLAHALPLASAYAALAAAPAAPPAPAAPAPGGGAAPDAAAVDAAALARQRRRLDPATGEPRFTNAGRGFRGTLDYVLYSADSLAPTALLELPDESEVRGRGGEGLPNEVWSSDHIALMAEFCYVPKAGEPGGAGGEEPRTPPTPQTPH